ncbi:MAG: HEAT repeat domain-containing protein [Gammaproteobacteria bacterium]|nr:HEAT repeat domain-containing protein [Gammaproteobacteria bacterium]
MLIIVVAAVIVGFVIRWSRHQNDLNNMVIFCIKYLIESKDDQEKINAAKALGHAKDPAALLVLLDVSNDKKHENKEVRHAAIDALHEMASHYSKYNKLIKSLLIASEQNNHQLVLDLLISHFEQDNDNKYVQSAYIIAREYIKLEQYEEARTWLQKAEFRNRRFIVYIDEIDELIELCTSKLFLIGDLFFYSEKYFKALEYYSSASQDLSDEIKQHYHAYMRLACVYCKLERYNEALEANLIAIQKHQEMEQESQQLQNLLREMINAVSKNEEPSSKSRHNHKELNSLTVEIMNKLSINNTDKGDFDKLFS